MYDPCMYVIVRVFMYMCTLMLAGRLRQGTPIDGLRLFAGNASSLGQSFRQALLDAQQGWSSLTETRSSARTVAADSAADADADSGGGDASSTSKSSKGVPDSLFSAGLAAGGGWLGALKQQLGPQQKQKQSTGTLGGSSLLGFAFKQRMLGLAGTTNSTRA